MRTKKAKTPGFIIYKRDERICSAFSTLRSLRKQAHDDRRWFIPHGKIEILQDLMLHHELDDLMQFPKEELAGISICLHIRGYEQLSPDLQLLVFSAAVNSFNYVKDDALADLQGKSESEKSYFVNTFHAECTSRFLTEYVVRKKYLPLLHAAVNIALQHRYLSLSKTELLLTCMMT